MSIKVANHEQKMQDIGLDCGFETNLVPRQYLATYSLTNVLKLT